MNKFKWVIKSSIRKKILIYMLANVVFFAILLFLANTFLLRSFYINEKKHNLLNISNSATEILGTINDINMNNPLSEEVLLELNKLEKIHGSNMFISNQDGLLLYPNQTRRIEGFREGEFFLELNLHRPNSRELPVFMNLERNGSNDRISIEYIDDHTYFVTMDDPRLKISTLRFQTTLENGTRILLWLPMYEITANIAIINIFILIMGLISIVVTIAWALFISRQIVRPITEMNYITKKMAALNFEEQLNIEGNDEIAELALSINGLSHKLDKTIGDLTKEVAREKELLSNVSHELKTPIFLIQGYAEGLKANVAADQEKRDYYSNVIIEESEKMDILVKDLLDLSALKSVGYNLSCEQFELSLLIDQVLLKYEHAFKQKSIMVETHLQPVSVHADPLRIEQVLLNYLNNAIDHCEGAKIIRVSMKKVDNCTIVSVYNSGRQLPEHEIENLWDSFYKIDKARTRDFGGTGLGLSIVKAIQEAHRQSYGVNNLEDGVEFWFSLAHNAVGNHNHDLQC